VVLVGNGPLVGFGVRSNDLALPGQLARHLAAHTQRGVDVHARVDDEMVATNVTASLPARALTGYDVVIFVLGVSEALTLMPIGQWQRGLTSVLRRVQAEAPDSGVLFIGPQPIRSIGPFDSRFGSIADRHGRVLNRVGERLVAQHPRADWMPLEAQRSRARNRHRTPEDYSVWAESIAARVAELLDEFAPDWQCPVSAASSPPAERRSDAGRAAAVEEFRAATEGPSPDLQRVVDLAQRMFDTDGAAITLLDEEHQWVRVGRTRVGDAIRREDSICSRTIEQDEVMVVPNVAADERFASNPVTTELGFYAGYPLMSPDGHRLGALCVYDFGPRGENSIDPTLLREIGLMAQRVLWSRIRRGRTP